MAMEFSMRMEKFLLKEISTMIYAMDGAKTKVIKASTWWGSEMAGELRLAKLVDTRGIGNRENNKEWELNSMGEYHQHTALTMRWKKQSSRISILKFPAKYILVNGKKGKEAG